MSTARTIAPAPIRKRLEVRAPLERTFEIFTSAMGTWWPKGHSVLSSPQMDVHIEPKVGGRWYEIGEDGSEYEWGEVRDWDAPRRVLLIWRLNAEFQYDPALTTEVEVRFAAGANGLTIVDFEHRGLEAFGAAAEPVRAGMDEGWAMILGGFKAAAEG